MNQKLLAAILNENVNTSADIAGFGSLNMDLISKIYPDTLVSQIANIQPSKSPLAKIAAAYTTYTGSGYSNSEGVYYTNSLILTMESASGCTYGASASVSGVPFVVVYKEKIPSNIAPAGWPLDNPHTELWQVLVKIDSSISQDVYESAGGSALDVFIPGTTTFLGDVVLSSSRNRTSIKKMFFNYGLYTTGTGEVIVPKKIGFEVKTINLETNARKIVSKISYEKLQDLKALYGGAVIESLISSLSGEISMEIDYEIIGYLKDIATPYMDQLISLPISAGGSIGVQNQLASITDDVYLAIFVMIESIVRKIKRNRSMFILCDSFTAAFLQLNPLHTKAAPDSNNPVRVGSIGAYPMFVDYYSTDNYVMVGYMYDGKTIGDAGLIYAPYVHELIEIDDSQDMFKKNVLAMSRYAYTRHPQDSGTGFGDSDFFSMCRVDFRNISNLFPFTL